jgi:hypothetical protein
MIRNLVTPGLVAAAVLLAATIAVLIQRDGREPEPEHIGWEGAPDQLHALVTGPPVVAPQHVGRHYRDTVEIVAVDYRPSQLSAEFAEALAAIRGQVTA